MDDDLKLTALAGVVLAALGGIPATVLAYGLDLANLPTTAPLLVVCALALSWAGGRIQKLESNSN